MALTQAQAQTQTQAIRRIKTITMTFLGGPKKASAMAPLAPTTQSKRRWRLSPSTVPLLLRVKTIVAVTVAIALLKR